MLSNWADRLLHGFWAWLINKLRIVDIDVMHEMFCERGCA